MDFDLFLHIAPRLFLAMLSGLVLGLNRQLHHKSAGVRTHSLVAIGAATAVLLVADFPQDNAQAVSRVLQGLITGIGFLGAGLIIQAGKANRIHGLTTAASIWAVALFGAAFGAGQYILGFSALILTLLVLIVGGSLEKFVTHHLPIRESQDTGKDKIQ